MKRNNRRRRTQFSTGRSTGVMVGVGLFVMASGCGAPGGTLNKGWSATDSEGPATDHRTDTEKEDAPAVCGDGVWQLGEICDTAIASGPGACDLAELCAGEPPAGSRHALAGAGCSQTCDVVLIEFTGDGTLDAADIDRFHQVIREGTASDHVATMDLDGDGDVDHDDVEVLIADYFHTYPGDANLDGRVDPVDLRIVIERSGTYPTGWAEGDFNGDGVTLTADLSIVGENWLQGTGPAVCGDGVWQLGEICDTAIASGPGACNLAELCAGEPPAGSRHALVGAGCSQTCDVVLIEFTGDGTLDAADIDRFHQVIREGTASDHVATMDLDRDRDVDHDDVDVLIRQYFHTLPGDINLDGRIDGADHQILLDHAGEYVDVGWAEGDLNGDGVVLSADVSILGAMLYCIETNGAAAC